MVNETEHNLQIVYLNPAAGTAGEENLHAVAAGATISTGSAVECTTHPVVARTDDGAEVARHETPICWGETWVIEQP